MASHDADGDGQSNIGEYIAGTNPTNAAAVFTVSQSSTGTGDTIIGWVSVEGRTYSVLRSKDLFSTYKVLESDIEHPQNSYTDTTHSAESAGYYKVDVRLK